MIASVRVVRQPMMAMRSRRSVVARAVDNDQVLVDVRDIIAEQLAKPVEEVTGESSFQDLGADSLDTVEIMMSLEEKFDLELEEEGAEKIATVKEAADMIAKQVAEQAK